MIATPKDYDNFLTFLQSIEDQLLLKCLKLVNELAITTNDNEILEKSKELYMVVTDLKGESNILADIGNFGRISNSDYQSISTIAEKKIYPKFCLFSNSRGISMSNIFSRDKIRIKSQKSGSDFSRTTPPHSHRENGPMALNAEFEALLGNEDLFKKFKIFLKEVKAFEVLQVYEKLTTFKKVHWKKEDEFKTEAEKIANLIGLGENKNICPVVTLAAQVITQVQATLKLGKINVNIFDPVLEDLEDVLITKLVEFKQRLKKKKK